MVEWKELLKFSPTAIDNLFIMPEIKFTLNIPADKYKFYYEGTVHNVVATALDGRRIQFPAHVLRSFVTHSGVTGVFVIRYDEHHRFVGIEKVGAVKEP